MGADQDEGLSNSQWHAQKHAQPCSCCGSPADLQAASMADGI